MAESTTTLTSTLDGEYDDMDSVLRVVVLHAADPNAIGRSVVLAKEPILIGRAGHVKGALGLVDSAVSRVHAKIELGASTAVATVTDEQSRNGTFVNGERVETVAVNPGDLIRVGGTLLLLQEIDAADLCLEPFADGVLLGDNPAIRRLRATIQEAAERDDAVLVSGESGTGKELVAQSLHRHSKRKQLVDINCGALPANLVESELFGYLSGAFTGAQRAKAGLFQVADGGTLFLDEVGELPMDLQPKLLRALSTGEIRPVGATESRRVDVRVCAATNRDLRELVAAGSFRGDLYARLARWTLHVPPLRERPDDVLVLARHFLGREGTEASIDVRAAEALVRHNWPFNVRELENVVAVAFARARDERVLTLAHLKGLLLDSGLATRDGETPESAEKKAKLPRGKRPTKAELLAALEVAGGNVAQVADQFGRERRQVYRWLHHYRIDVETLREKPDDPDAPAEALDAAEARGGTTDAPPKGDA